MSTASFQAQPLLISSFQLLTIYKVEGGINKNCEIEIDKNWGYRERRVQHEQTGSVRRNSSEEKPYQQRPCVNTGKGAQERGAAHMPITVKML